MVLNTFRGALGLKRRVSLKTHHKMNIYQNKHVELPTLKKMTLKNARSFRFNVSSYEGDAIESCAAFAQWYFFHRASA